MPVPLAPYPTPPAPYTPPANGVQSQLVCSGCRNLLVFPVGATSVCCAVCNAVTAVPPPDKSETLVCDRHRNGPVSMWRLPYFTHVHPGRDKCAMFLLSHCQSSFGSKSGGTCQLWQLQDATRVPIWSKIREMCSLQFCNISWGHSKHH
ncbi:protein LOL1-like isoform X1 [Glycine max]|uniref:protein LOL1-like isoform X1 n=1 Tax=Glycine max TaxID=3847 RepID=UPI001B357FE7|nr:uncharacterized protein LOC100306356 isoform X1 [Glycine max]